MTDKSQSLRIDLSQTELLLRTFIDNKELYQDYEKTELLEKYEGTYNGNGHTVTIDKDGKIICSMNTAIDAMDCRLRGNVITSTLYGPTEKEIYTLTFSSDGKTVTYKSHDGTEYTLTKN